MDFPEHPNPERSPESLEARLRALPPPAVPADLEARVLATIPATVLMPVQRPWAVWVGAVTVLAAACLLAILAWPRLTSKLPVPRPAKEESVRQDTPRPADHSDSVELREIARRGPDELGPPTFTWPLPEAGPRPLAAAIPPDLLD
jgi:hypothetical protein